MDTISNYSTQVRDKVGQIYTVGKDDVQKIATSEFAKSVYNIGLDSIMLAFALIIAMMFYTAIKGTVNRFFKFENQNIMMKYGIAVMLVIIFVGVSLFLKNKFGYIANPKVNYSVMA